LDLEWALSKVQKRGGGSHPKGGLTLFKGGGGETITTKTRGGEAQL